MEQACWWRLKAEEVRTHAEALSAAEAKDTMKTVAETWDQMAEDLERRLAPTRPVTQASLATDRRGTEPAGSENPRGALAFLKGRSGF